MAGTIGRPGSATLSRPRWLWPSLGAVVCSTGAQGSRPVLPMALAVMIGAVAEGRLWDHYPLLTLVNLLCFAALAMPETTDVNKRVWAALTWLRETGSPPEL